MLKKGMVFLLLAAVGTAMADNLDALFPQKELEPGWMPQGQPVHYMPDNLYEYIDGEAELYLSYGFKELAALVYYAGSPEDTFVTVDVYDMDKPLDAFGLYSNLRFPDYTYETMGTEGFSSDFGLTFLKGQFVVQIKFSDSSPSCRRVAKALAAMVDQRIADQAVFPDRITLLPDSGQVSYTLKYFARDMLNQAFLPEGFEAKYRIDGEQVTGFVVLFKNTQDAEDGCNRLRAFFRESGAEDVHDGNAPSLTFAVKTEYHNYTLIGLNGKTLFGVQDLVLPEIGFGLMRNILKSTTEP